MAKEVCVGATYWYCKMIVESVNSIEVGMSQKESAISDTLINLVLSDDDLDKDKTSLP